MSLERHGGSRLPDDPAYWKALAARATDASFAAEARGTAAAPWWRALSDAVLPLAAAALLALVAGPLLLDERRAATRAADGAHTLAAALAPADPLLGTLLAGDASAPPSTALLTLLAVREQAR